jgi:hypothetical protein
VIEHFNLIIEKKDLFIDFLKDKIKKLEYNLKNNKIFLNMVVHDMRSPTKQIEYLLEQSLEYLNLLNVQVEQVKSMSINFG